MCISYSYIAAQSRASVDQNVEVLKMQNKTRQRNEFVRLLALLLCAAVLLPLSGWEALAGGASVQHGVTTLDQVLFRKEARDGADHYGYLGIGQVLEVLGTATGSGRTWYKVKGEPLTPKVTYIGYVREDVFRPLTAQEEANFAATGDITSGGVVVPTTSTTSDGNVATATPAPTASSGYVRITQTRTNLRNQPDGASILQLDKNVIVPYSGDEVAVGAYRWIYVTDPKTYNRGFVRSDCYQFVDAAGSPTAGPGLQPLPPAPTGKYLPKPYGNYAIVTVDAANIYQTPGSIGLWPMSAGSVVTLTGKENNGWFPAQYKGYTGYVRAAHIRMMTDAELAGYLGDGVVPGVNVPAPAPSQGYVRITAVRVNLRNRPDGESILQMDKDQVIPCYGAPQYKNGIAWQYVYYTPARMYGYVHQSFYQYTDQNGKASATATPPPQTTLSPQLIAGYVKLIKPGVNLRATPGGESLAQLPKDTILPYEGAPVYAGGYNWVNVTEPATRRRGYVRSDCYQYVDASGNPAAQPDMPTPMPSFAPGIPNGPAASGTLKLIKGGVNLRVQPSGAVIARLDIGTVLNYYGIAQKDGYTWYYVQSNMGYGYIRGDMANVTPGNNAQPAPTSAPGNSYGYLVTIKSNVNLRRLPDGLTLLQVAKSKVYPISATPVYKGSYTWYFVQAEGHTGYLRGDCVRQMTAEEIAAYLQNGTVPSLTPSVPGGSYNGAAGHVITTMNAVNVRVSPSLDAGVVAQLNIGTVLPYQSAVNAGGKMWYQVTYNGLTAYMLGSTVRIMSAQEYEAWKNGQPTPTAGPSARPEELSNTAVTVMDRVLLRREGSMSSPVLTVLYRAGSRVDLLGAPTAKDGYTWRPVRSSNVSGFIRSDMLRILSKSEAGNGAGNTTPGKPPVVVYRTLRKGMSGADVTALQNALIQLGLLPNGSASGIYTTQTEDAVRKYQKAANLFVDGVAGQHTQNAIFNTSAPGDNNGGSSTVDPTIYPVEIVDWYTGDIQSVWLKGETATITDVKTGISFRARRWSGGYHADVEPLTAQDTAAMCRIYGVSRAQEISEKNLYQRRPLWVTLKGRTFAASMYGVPHNYPQGDTIPGNEYYGQFCVHFYNSRTHSSGRVDSDHMAAIRYAYDHAPSRK